MMRKIILMAILGAISMQTKAQYDTYINQMMYQEQILANERYERYAEVLRAANEAADAMASASCIMFPQGNDRFYAVIPLESNDYIISIDGKSFKIRL